ncbi:Helicase conserved C-terminal domain-containing protein [Nocardia amikacinitolerans]|uniref:DEAD/DEAH box helicase n=1 Tax=Nocardia amikacinitolerans TaxID=756689 RepID=UPI0020A415DC|nr:DEAD/DEAH box helicase [Nocardia amikacinitolerans]MCP2298325.1 Helicase conserved C-terminal domain-containing protein [Nocardia amikacinitolerans]
MIFAELVRDSRPIVGLEKREDAKPGAWARLQEALSRGIVGGTADTSQVRADVFFAELKALQEVRVLFGEKFDFGPILTEQLRTLSRDRRDRQAAMSQPIEVSIEDLQTELKKAGFTRQLKPFQVANLAVIHRMPHGADFSVPGAGKTTVALANYVLNRARGSVQRLLVIAPIAAFQAWKEDSAACIEPAPGILVHGGPGSLIPDNTEVLLTNYNRVAADYDRIREFVATKPTQVILDEAHRIKRGENGVHGRAVLDLAYAARRRDVLTGTPAPQGAYDLVAPIRFLYPGQDQDILPDTVYNQKAGRDEDVVTAASAAISRYFVRTPKTDLGLPPTTFDIITEPMPPIQQAIYDSLIGQYRGRFQLDTQDRRKFDRLGRITMYLLEGATNPMLLTAGSDVDDQEGFEHPPLEITGNEAVADLLLKYRDLEVPWKYEKVAAIVEAAARKGEKVIIWSTFVRNLKLLANYLRVYQPALVHGGVPYADTAKTDQVTRDMEFDRFRFDPNCRVLLANPAACGEGVSLHHWCHHAIYLDRTFNAGHFLQSQDRIHRLGLADTATTRFTLLISRGTIDELVDGRLREKVRVLAQLMADPGLVKVALPEPDTDARERAGNDDDIAAVASMLQAGR